MSMQNNEKRNIYEMFRACRLCGAGGGYKMPIMQNVVNVDSTVELRHKIRDCVQIEVHAEDKMPPLICELCVDKINDFYEFIDLCKQTDMRTRNRLGLPPQAMPSGSPEDSILGVTEPVFLNKDADSDEEPLTKSKSDKNQKYKKIKSSKEVVKLQKTPGLTVTKVSSGKRRRSPTPPPKRTTRQEQAEKLPIITIKQMANTKQMEFKAPTPKKKAAPTPPPKTPTSAKKNKSAPSAGIECPICKFKIANASGLVSHQRSHTVSFTKPKLACNACRLWFVSAEEASAHAASHRQGVPFHCDCCYGDFDTVGEYEGHFDSIPCRPLAELPDVQCASCWRPFATETLREQHRCLGEDGRPGGKCDRCSRTYSLLKNLKKHQSTCLDGPKKSKGNNSINQDSESPYSVQAKRRKKSTDTSFIPFAIMNQLKPLQIRVARCDPLLQKKVKGQTEGEDHYDVSEVYGHYGLDMECYYPFKYLNSFVKNESFYADLLSSLTKPKEEVTSPKIDSFMDKKEELDNNDFSSNIDSIIDSLDDVKMNGDKEDTQSLESADIVLPEISESDAKCQSPDITKEYKLDKEVADDKLNNHDVVEGNNEKVDDTTEEETAEPEKIENGLKSDENTDGKIDDEIDDQKLLDVLDEQIGGDSIAKEAQPSVEA